MTIELTFKRDNFDRDAHFAFEYLDYKKRPTVAEGYLFRDPTDGQIFLMKSAAMIKDSYSAADIAHTDRIYRGEQVVRSGDTVLVDGKPHTVKVLGNYSDAGRLYAA